MAQKHTRLVTPVQLFALLLAFLSASVLMGVLSAGLLVPVAGSGAVVTKAVPTIFDDLPGELQIVHPAEESQMLDASGTVIARFYDKQRIVVPSDNIASTIKATIVAVEDKRFYEHRGVDATGIGRAFISNLSGASTQGASTITQQFVRNALQERGYLEGDAELVSFATEQTPQRKLREIKYALALETRMTKDEILTGYLNIAPFGPITYGVEAASRLYFSKSASELGWSEAALLAGLVKSPVEYNPLEYPEAAQERRNIVLGVLRDEGLITSEEYDTFHAQTVEEQLNPNVTNEGCNGANDAMAYFCTYVIEQFLTDESFGTTRAEREHLLKTGGLTIRTTIDPYKQEVARNVLLGAIPDEDSSGLDTALIALEPSTGRVIAMAQNTSFGIEEGKTMSNYAADGQFQVGSTFKIFTLIEWFKEGHLAYESIGRSNTTYGSSEFTCGGAPYYTDTYTVTDLGGTLKQGTMNAIKATGLSANQAFVNMASKLDFCAIFQTAADFGITNADGSVVDAYPANILGSNSASPLEMARAFGAIANDGKLCAVQSMTTVHDSEEVLLKEFQPDCPQIVPSDVAQKVTTVLNLAVETYYTSTRLTEGRTYAAKSGTTNANSNTWLTGFTPQLVTSAWVGYANASTTPVNDIWINGQYYDAIYGESFVGQNIWAPFMSTVLSGQPVIPVANVYIGTPRVTTTTTNPSSTSTTNPGQAATQGSTSQDRNTQGQNANPGSDDD